ncbi:hypothetical protein DNTS_009473 [Danionella cerebrum]|uniref:Rhodopsin-sensitive cGMP 3',5'-cyclic phosphodiesterase subunit gamma n=1 Tax=Danionella cerebrum TaxID=2873325 RepID=A0A553PWY1_9TELE|nr:hypothetical protein DNTS_009473 [Danionella translucida]
MNAAPPAGSALATPAATTGPTTPKKGPPKFKQRAARTFKSKAPKPGQKGLLRGGLEQLILHPASRLSHWSHLPNHRQCSGLESLFGDDIPGMEGLGTDFTVVCPWEAFGDMELSDLAKYGII